jgi:hypothetical protein
VLAKVVLLVFVPFTLVPLLVLLVVVFPSSWVTFIILVFAS